MDRVPQEQCELIPQSQNAPKVIGQGIAKWSRIGPQVVATLSGMLTMISFGFHTGWPAPTLTRLLAEDSDIPVTPLQGAWIVGFFPIGCVCSTLAASFFADTWGRKKSLLASTFPCIAGSVLIAFVQSYQWLYFARFLIGLGVGISATAAPLYTGEIAEDRLRGVLGASINCTINFGMVLAYCIGPWVNRQILAVLGAAIAGLCSLIFVWMPETPYFLVMNNKLDEAREKLIWLRGTTNVAKEFEMIQQTVKLDPQNASSFKDLAKTASNRKALFITMGLSLGQEFSGIAAINAYSGLVFQESRTDLSTNVSLMIVALIQLLSGFVAMFVIKLAGRRPILLLSTIGVIISHSSEALYFQLQAAGIDVSSIFWLPVTAIVGFTVSYTIGLGVLPPAMYPEFFPCNVRAKALTVIYATAFISLSVNAQIYEIISDWYGVHYAFWFFAGTTILLGNFVYLFVPETRNKSFHDIQNNLRNADGWKFESTPVKSSSDIGTSVL